MKKLNVIFLLVALVVSMTACGGGFNLSDQNDAVPSPVGELESVSEVTTSSEPIALEIDYDPEELDVIAPENTEETYVYLEGDTIAVEGSGAVVNGSSLTITSGGVFSISGNLNDGEIVVDTQDSETVFLKLNGVDITSSSSAPIYVKSADNTIISLEEGTNNVLTDGKEYIFTDGEDEPDAAIFSKDDLVINGSGSLTVNANYKNGIAGKDDLIISGGNILVNAPNDGIKGRDSVVINDGTIVLNAGSDGIQSNNDEEAGKGFVVVEGGLLDITSGLDGIQAETSLVINGGELNIETGGGSVESTAGGNWGGRGMEGNSNQTEESIKGLKAGLELVITGGTFGISALDDAIHSNGTISINGGTFSIASGDDGIHADESLTINGGDLNIKQSYEGLESSVITINDGSIQLVASDDGVNTSSGTSAVNGQPMQGGQPGEFDTGDNFLQINGGYLAIDAGGDGIDANSPVEMTGGVVLINGPVAQNNGPLDYTGYFNINGGFLVAVGSSGMAQTPSTTSTQYSIMQNFQTFQPAGTIVHIETESGEEILTFAPTKEYQSVLFSSPVLEDGSNYVYFTEGSSTGEVKNGLYTGGDYMPGTMVASITISGIVTGEGGMGGFPGGQGGPGGRGGRPGGSPPPEP